MNILAECSCRGIRLEADGDALKVDAPKGAMTDELKELLRAHKPELLAALSEKINRWRVTNADGRVTEHSSAGLTEAEALALSRSWDEPVKAELIAKPTASHPGDLSGVSPEFAARLSPEDLDDIAAGDIPLETVQAFEQAAIVREAEDLREHFEERAGILEYDAGLPRPEAELEAAKITATYARNCGYQWVSLRSALSAYPKLLASLPCKAGPVDSLPLGAAKLAVLPGKLVVRQGASPERRQFLPRRGSSTPEVAGGFRGCPAVRCGSMP